MQQNTILDAATIAAAAAVAIQQTKCSSNAIGTNY